MTKKPPTERPVTPPEALTSNQAYWDYHSNHSYNWHAATTVDDGGKQPRPEELSLGRYGGFIRVPIDKAVFWGFTREEYRDRFVEDVKDILGVA